MIKGSNKLVTRADILDKAKQCVCQDRDNQYGSPEDNFRIIAALWSVCLKEKTGYDITLEPHDVAVAMSLLKIARIVSGKAKADSWIDMAGYAGCGGELQLRGSKDESEGNVE